MQAPRAIRAAPCACGRSASAPSARLARPPAIAPFRRFRKCERVEEEQGHPPHYRAIVVLARAAPLDDDAPGPAPQQQRQQHRTANGGNNHNNNHGHHHHHHHHRPARANNNADADADDSAAAAATTTTPPTRPELLAAVRRFVDTAFRAVREGPDAAAPELAAQLHPAVTLAADPVRRSPEQHGAVALLAELGRLHAEYGPGATHRPLLFGASLVGGEGDDLEAEEQGGNHNSSKRRAAVGAPIVPPPSTPPRAYALLEARYQDVNALPGHPATFRVSTVAWLVALELGRPPPRNGGGESGGNGGNGGGNTQTHHQNPSEHVITRVWLRRQLTYEDRDELLVDPVGVYPAQFPHALLSPLSAEGGGGGDDAAAATAGKAMARAVRAWWGAWGPRRNGNGGSAQHRRRHNGGSSGEDETGAAAAAAAAAEAEAPPPLPVDMLDPGFGFYDAYGLWPTMRQASSSSVASSAATTSGGGGGGLHHAALRGPLAVQRYASVLSARYRVDEWRVLDAAPAEGQAACFAHWRARLSPLPRGGARGSAAGSAAGSASSAAPAPPPPPPVVIVEGFEVDLFAPPTASGDSSTTTPPLLRGVYLFRGPLLGSERSVFLAYQREQALAREEATLAARRAARERALADAAARLDEYQRWIASSLRRWGDKVYRAGAAGAAVLFSEEDGAAAAAGGGGAGAATEQERREREERERRRREEERARREEGEEPLGPPGI